MAAKLLLAIIIASIVTVGPASLISRIVSNAGLLALARSLVQEQIIGAAGSNVPNLINTDRWLEVATSLDETNQGAWRGLGFIFEMSGQRVDAITAWQQAGLTVQDFVIWGGHYPVHLQRPEEALYWHTLATEFAPNSDVAWFHRAWSQESLGSWQDVLSAYEKAIQLSKQDRPTVGLGTIYYRKGMVHQWMQSPSNLSSAIQSYEAALAAGDFVLRTENADCYTRLGQILQWQAHDIDRQIDLFHKAIATDPTYSTPYVLLGYAYYLHDGDVNVAMAQINKALILVPNYPSAYWYLGEIYLSEGLTTKAREMYQKVLSLNPDFEAAQHRLQELGQVP
ncbi:hypothetical protein TFLX_04073 [Thermoflexales bacterium]|nr:hypothetical protein TFLX_04073 [Thermoflexales bacterium]